MTSEFSKVVVDEGDFPLLWELRRIGDTYLCRKTELDQVALQRVRSQTRQPTAEEFNTSGPFEEFSDIELARRYFATHYDGRLERQASDFFAQIEPARYQLDLAESASLRAVLDASHPHPWILAGTATHAVAMFAYASNGSEHLWSFVFGGPGYSVRTWKLTAAEFDELRSWDLNHADRLASDDAASPPIIRRPPDRETIVNDRGLARSFLANGDDKLDFTSRDLYNLLWPEAYARVAFNERPALYEAMRVR